MSFDVTTLALAKSYADQHGGGGASTTGDLIIKMTIEVNDNNYTVTSCDATVEQIDAAVAAEKRVVVITSYSGIIYELPMIWGAEGYTYHFGTVQDGRMVTSLVITDGSTSEWDFSVTQTDAVYVDYSNAALPSVTNVRGALDELVSKSHSPVYYIDLAGTYPNYTCPVAMDDIKAAYNSGYNLICRCTLGKYTATLPLFAPMPAANTWIFSGSGALKSMGFAAQSFTVAIAANGVVAQNVALSQPLHITVGNTAYTYDGSLPVDIDMDGITPTIGDNGNWYIGSTDTGKPSRGEKGDKGDMPVKGTDYWTAADKAEIVADTLAALPTWTGGNY